MIIVCIAFESSVKKHDLNLQTLFYYKNVINEMIDLKKNGDPNGIGSTLNTRPNTAVIQVIQTH